MEKTFFIVLIFMAVLVFSAALNTYQQVQAQEDVLFEMNVDKTVATIGELINFTLTLTNIGTETVTINYTPPLFDVYYCTPQGCFSWSDGKAFFLWIVEITLEPGENYSKTLTWNLYQYIDGEYYPPKPGIYYLFGVCYPLELKITGPVTVELQPIEAMIDITPNSLHLISRDRWITYIELPEGHNVSNINRTTILLNDTIPVDPFWIDKPLESVIGDYDNDSIPDLMVKFDRQAVIWLILKNYVFTDRFGNVTLTVDGLLYDGIPFQGSDIIRIILYIPSRMDTYIVPA